MHGERRLAHRQGRTIGNNRVAFSLPKRAVCLGEENGCRHWQEGWGCLLWGDGDKEGNEEPQMVGKNRESSSVSGCWRASVRTSGRAPAGGGDDHGRARSQPAVLAPKTPDVTGIPLSLAYPQSPIALLMTDATLSLLPSCAPDFGPRADTTRSGLARQVPPPARRIPRKILVLSVAGERNYANP